METISPLTPAISDRERNAAMIIHLIILIIPFLVGFSPGLTGLLVAAIAVSTDPLKSEFVSYHAKQSFLFHAAWLCVSLVFTMGLGMMGALPFLFLLWVVYVVIGGWRARRGLDYPLPWQWR